ncbi:MAG: TetR/AcrR family transcriptional regulator [Lachnospiraceae bacterium]|nr:TetR/AcrR family transcriptional regulator [Lachnospiraceae bacterium]
MARKETVTKEMIKEGAFLLAKEKGFAMVTARKLAEKIGCSTQPIFRIYNNMSELEIELFDQTADYFSDYYLQYPHNSETPFLDLGMAYIKFARDEKFLFEILFLNENKKGIRTYDLVNGGNHGFIRNELKKISDISQDEAGMLFSKIWIFIHGMACMALSNDFDLTENETKEMLIETYQAFVRK